VAARTLNRRALRDQNDAAEVETDDGPADDDGGGAPAPKVKKPRAKKAAGAKAPAKPRVRKKVAKAGEVMFARWAVCDNGAKRVAVFDYRDRAAADAKLAEVRAAKPGTFFLVLVKDPGDPPAPPAVPPLPTA
jgi:hypothetical protein